MPLQPLHLPEDLAAMLGRSKWWVCEQCRHRRFPFVNSGGSYRFTDQHVEQILTLLEEAPGDRPRTNGARRAAPKRAKQPEPAEVAPAVQLKARPPRRRQIAPAPPLAG
jgi:hypothetical protein